ncbi:MAG: 1,4-dihydroxy-2-naphthoate polyprenyltransferase [Demequinaceae bacterium]|nr:1,4-dihydroxy-2-naphthoate polyprenyltransferase [Demequinaceae bacterium]
MTATVGDWIAGARPRTLTTAIAPVAVGTASAGALGSFRPLYALLALGVALSLQVAVNYANDYSDGVRGTDVDRVGPERLVASGKAGPSAVRAAATMSFVIGSLFGLALTALSGEWILLSIGVAAIVAAWTYTGSSRPYGYAGWGELSVFVFFGLVATLGTMLSQAGQITSWAVVASVGVGLHAVAMLLVNNIRDLKHDSLAGKRTLAVRLGDRLARHLFAACVTLPLMASTIVAFSKPWSLLTLLLLLPSILMATLTVVANPRGRALGAIFAAESILGLCYGLLLALGIALG